LAFGPRQLVPTFDLSQTISTFNPGRPILTFDLRNLSQSPIRTYRSQPSIAIKSSQPSTQTYPFILSTWDNSSYFSTLGDSSWS